MGSGITIAGLRKLTRISSMLAGRKGEEIIRYFVLLLVVFVMTACARVQPIYTVQGHPIPTASANLTPGQITQVITSVAQSKGWLVDPISPTEIRATQKWRTHSATVIISNDGRTFAIRNDGSSNLLQNGDSIHHEYNKRVHALEDAIEKQLYRRP